MLAMLAEALLMICLRADGYAALLLRYCHDTLRVSRQRYVYAMPILPPLDDGAGCRAVTPLRLLLLRYYGH